eukprot:7355174-Pyramimonas_sp.AAC.1
MALRDQLILVESVEVVSSEDGRSRAPQVPPPSRPPTRGGPGGDAAELSGDPPAGGQGLGRPAWEGFEEEEEDWVF